MNKTTSCDASLSSELVSLQSSLTQLIMIRKRVSRLLEKIDHKKTHIGPFIVFTEQACINELGEAWTINAVMPGINYLTEQQGDPGPDRREIVLPCQ